MNHWREFEDGLRRYLPKPDEEVISVLRHKYLRTNSEFRHSKQCKSLLRQYLQRIASRPSRLYMILNDLKTALKQQTTKVSLNIRQKHESSMERSEPDREKLTDVDSRNTGLCSPVLLQLSEEPHTTSNGPTTGNSSQDDDVIILDEPPTPPNDKPHVTDKTSNIPSTSRQPSSKPDPTPSVCPDASRRTIVERLENLLSRLSKAIRSLEEEELDLDALDSGNSSYMQLDGLKRRYLQVWHRLCEARKLAPITGRIARRRFTYEGCKYPSVNSRIERLVNEKRKFPDYTDIRRIVAVVNRDDNLQLPSSAVTDLAREIFVDVGHLLKRRRQDDLRQDLGCHLTDDMREEEDPTYYDPILRRQLAHNKAVGEVRLNAVFNRFVQLQDASDSPDALADVDNQEIPADEDPSRDSVETSRTPSDNEGDSNLKDSPSHDELAPTTSVTLPSTSHEVLSLSSESDSEHPDETSTTGVQSTYNQARSSSPIITLPDDDDSSESSANMAIVATSGSLPKHSISCQPSIPPRNAYNQAQPGSAYCSTQQFFHTFPTPPGFHQTQQASQTVTLTRQFGYNGLESVLHTTQVTTSKVVCQQLPTPPPPTSFYPLFSGCPRPSRGRLTPLHGSHSRRGQSSTFKKSRHNINLDEGSPNRTTAPDCETIVLD